MPNALKPSSDPLRSLDWRWNAARQLLQPPRRSRRTISDASTSATGDEWIAHARDFIGGCHRTSHCPGVEGAIALRKKSRCRRRWEVEALLLTDMPYSGIAKRCRISEQTVEAFHSLFFDVRDRLAERDWINSLAVRHDSDGNCDDCGHGEIWRKVAYDHGVVMLDMHMAVMLNRQLPKKVVAALGPDHVRREAELKAQIELSIDRMKARTDEQRASLVLKAEEVRKQQVMTYGDESPAERAARVFDEVFLYNSKLYKAAMRKAAREKANI
jgi:hypothetical protein